MKMKIMFIFCYFNQITYSSSYCDTYWESMWLLGSFEDDVWNKRSCKKTSFLKQASHPQDGKRFTNDYVLKVYQITQNTIYNNGKKMEDVVLIQNMLNALLQNYEGFIQTIISQNVLPSFEKLVSKLFYE